MALHCWPFVLLQISLVWGLKLTISSSTVTIGQPASVTWTFEPQDQLKTFAIVPVFSDIHISTGKPSDWTQFFVSPQGKETNIFSTPITTPGTFHFEAYSTPLSFNRRNVINRQLLNLIPGVNFLAKSDSITAQPGSSASAGTPSESPTAASSSSSDTVASPTPSDPSSSVITQTSSLTDREASKTVLFATIQSQSSVPSTSTSKSDVSLTGTPSQQLGTSTLTMTSSASITVTPESRSGSISNKNKLLAIILASIFGALILSIAIILIVLWIRRRNKNRGGTTLVSSDIPGNPRYSKSDSWVSVSEKRFSEYSASDCDSTSIAPSDSISQVLHYTQTSAKRNHFVPSTTLTTVPEGENAVVADTNINSGPES